ncbi:hypothetical protein J1605_015708 [Eschrichtius robustus]|uniref:Uncharacterized protein n=1 Tax=Eschrichtius robustus TaxID=9764 RepID=A0AB34G9X4_ESCRO|nr:hypothetical protein J1605_015708 [Eschrichtius robustus]
MRFSVFTGSAPFPHASFFYWQETMAKMEVKTSLLDNMIGVGDMVLLEPLNEETVINNLKKRFDHNEIYSMGYRRAGSVVVARGL